MAQTHAQVIFNSINKTSLSSFTTTCFTLVGVALVGIVPLKIHSMNICNFKAYPYFMWAYAIHLFTTPGMLVLGLMILFARSKNLFAYVVREVKSDLRNMFECC